MFRYRIAAAAEEGVVVTGTGGATLVSGQTITGAAVRDVVLQNGVVKVTYEACAPAGELGASHMYLMVNGAWQRCLAQQYGDWTFFAAPWTTACNQIDVIVATSDAVEIAMTWTNHRLDVAYLNNLGIVYRTYDGSLIYRQGAVNPNFDYLAFTRVTKTVRLERGRRGYFTGYGSEPRVGPSAYLLSGIGASANNDTAYGERELGTGSGSAVVESSAGVVSRHPAWGQKPEWAIAEATLGVLNNHPAWFGIDDPISGTLVHPLYIATQAAGYPRQQLIGPWYAFDISDSLPVARFTAHQRPIQSGSWQFGAQSGVLVNHLVNQWNGLSGVPLRYQTFTGALSYIADTSNGYANEPSGVLRAAVAAEVNALVWPV